GAQPVVFFREVGRGRAKEFWFQRLFRDRMRQLAAAQHVNNLLAVELVLVKAIPAIVLEDAIVDSAEKRGESMIVFLRPLIEWVVVTLGTHETDAEEYLSRRLGAGVRLAQRAVVVRCGVAI